MKYTFLSILMHLVILLSFVFGVFHLIDKNKKRRFQVIPAYVIKTPQTLSHPIIRKKSHTPLSSQPRRQIKSQQHHILPVAFKKEGANQHFVDLLHDQIQSALIYPSALNNFIRNKNVRVAFVLTPQGMVKTPHILYSSNNEILDKAVINAIFAIQPVLAAKKFLHQNTTFTLTIKTHQS